MKREDIFKMAELYRSVVEGDKVTEGKCGGKKPMKEECCEKCGEEPCVCKKAKKEDVEQELDTSLVESVEEVEQVHRAAAQSSASAYRGMWEAAGSDRAKHYKGATPPEPWLDNESDASKMYVDAHNKSTDEDDTEEEGHKDVVKAGAPSIKQAPARRGDNRNGDSIQKPKDTTKK